MSAFIVSKTHIDALLSAGLYQGWSTYGHLRWFDSEEPDDTCYEVGEAIPMNSSKRINEHQRELTEETAGRVGALLWSENRRSVNHRYAEDEWEEPYVFFRLRGKPDPVAVLKAISGYEYQSCEHPEWMKSEARYFCEALRGRAIRNLSGYDEADTWHIDSPFVFDSAF